MRPPLLCLFLLVAVFDARLSAAWFQNTDDWYYGEIDNIRVLSNAPVKRTERMVKELRQFRLALGEFIPYFAHAYTRPLALIVCADEETFELIRGEVYEVSEARPFSRWTISELQEYHQGPSEGILITRGDYARSNIDLAHWLYAELLLERANLPLWAQNALAGLAQTVEVKEDEILLGKVDWTGFLMKRVSQLEGRKVIDLSDILTYNVRDLRDAESPVENYLFRGRAFVFAHYCTFTRERDLRENFLRFVDLSSSYGYYPGIVEAVMGMTEEELEGEVRSVVKWRHRYNYMRLDADDLPEIEPIQLEPATAWDRDLFIALGHARSDREVARSRLAACLQQKPDDPRPWETLALVEHLEGDADAMAEAVENAVEKGSTNPRVLTRYANHLLDTWKAEADSERYLMVEQLKQVLRPLGQALARDPGYPQAFEVLGDAWLAFEHDIPEAKANEFVQFAWANGQRHLQVVTRVVRILERVGNRAAMEKIATEYVKVGSKADIEFWFAFLDGVDPEVAKKARETYEAGRPI